MLKFPKPQRKKKPPKPLNRKRKFHAKTNELKVYKAKYTPEQVLAYSKDCRARRLANPTREEQAFREILIDHPFYFREGREFEREHIEYYPGGFAIFDFFFAKHALAIEIDGNAHRTQVVYDRERDNYFASQTIKTIRFENKTILKNKAQVIQTIQEALELEQTKESC